jgi:tetratricopeptide (TPR) repeat protein
MGVVYMGHDPELQRKVALKVLGSGVVAAAGPAARARFLREARALATLSHPNVTTIYDAVASGEDAADRFIAMELIEGETLAEWLAREPRSTDEILEIFHEAGKGLSAAHAAGVVHRDFKPANVLVGRDGRVRVTDFGLALGAKDPEDDRATVGRSSSVASSLTRTGALVGTPRYMAPELREGQRADVRSDIYAFCASLYDAFAGPTAERAPRAAPVPRPWLRALLVAGLAADPALRPASMDAVLASIAHGLGARRRWALRAGTGVAALLLGGLIWMAVPTADAAPCVGVGGEPGHIWTSERQSQVRAKLQEIAGPLAAQATTAVDAALRRYAGNWSRDVVDACVATHVRKQQSPAFLDQRMACLSERLRAFAGLVETLVEVNADSLPRLVAAALGLPAIEPCSDPRYLNAAVRPPEAADLRARVRALRDALARPRALRAAGRYDDAARQLSPLVEKAQHLGYRPALAEALLLRGEVQADLGRSEEARASFEESILAADSTKHDEVAARAKTALSLVLGVGLSRKEEALRALEHAGAAVERAGGHASLEAPLEDVRGEVLAVFSQSRAAAEARRRAMTLWARTAGPGSLEVAGSLNGYANAVWDLGQLEEARAAYEQVRKLRERSLGDSHPLVATAIMNLAGVTNYLGDYPAAMALQRRVLEIRVAVYGPEHTQVAIIKNNMGDSLDRQGRRSEALTLFREALAGMRRGYPADHPYVLAMESNVASALLGLDRIEEAVQDLRALHQKYARVLGAQNPETANAMVRLAAGLIRAGQIAEGEELIRRARTIGWTHADPGAIELSLGESFRRVGECRKAMPFLTAGLDALAKPGTHNHHRWALLEAEIAECQLRFGEHVAAAASVERGIARLSKVQGVDLDRARMRFVRARILWRSSAARAAARREAEAAAELLRKAGAAESAAHREISGWLAVRR